MSVFRMPSLGADMDAAKLVEWLVAPGERVRRGDVVAVVETAKGAIEIEIFQDAVIGTLLAQPGETLPVGAPIAELVEATETALAAPPAMPAKPAEAAARPSAGSAAVPRPVPSATARVRATPAARRRAAVLGITLDRLRGTGVDGAIRLADLPAGTDARLSPATARRPTGFDPTAMRRAIGAAMARSKREIPHYYLTQTADMTAALVSLAVLNASRPPADRILPAAMLLRAAALAIAATPELNGYWEADCFRAADGVHVGWAVALRGGGLIAPAIRHADRLTLDGLMTALRDLVQRARSGGLRGSELTAPSITITSLGERGAESVLPIIHPPQVAMIGIGRIVRRPWVVGDAVQPRDVVTLSLAGDHRASDGHLGGRLLSRMAGLLEDPQALQAVAPSPVPSGAETT